MGLVKTLKAYAWPMARWMHNAAGGTNHRLKPGPATEWDRSNKSFTTVIPFTPRVNLSELYQGLTFAAGGR
jgi:hypothetical protein